MADRTKILIVDDHTVVVEGIKSALADGTSIKKIADRLCISPKTVESHKYNLMEKLGIDSLAEMTKIAIKKKLIEP